jgi:hypothetical protein
VLDHLPERDRDPVSAGCAGRGRRPTTSGRSSSCRPWPVSWSAPIPAPPGRCARAWRRHSRSPAWASRASSARRSRRRTRANRWCATRRHAKGENRRTTLIRAGWDTGPGPMQRLGEAGGSRGAGSRAGGESGPDDVAGRAVLPDDRVRASKTERQSEARRWSKPIERSQTARNLADLGRVQQ